MNITILGAGNIGGALAPKWAAAGHIVTFGVRDANSPKTQAALAGVNALVLPVSEAIAASDIVLFSIPWGAVPDTAQANAAALDGKILIDATNNFAGPVINNLAALKPAAPNATDVRAANPLGSEHFAEPARGGVHTAQIHTAPAAPEVGV